MRFHGRRAADNVTLNYLDHIIRALNESHYYVATFVYEAPKIFSPGHVEEQLQVRPGPRPNRADARKRSTRVATMPRQGRKHAAAEGPEPPSIFNLIPLRGSAFCLMAKAVTAHGPGNQWRTGWKSYTGSPAVQRPPRVEARYGYTRFILAPRVSLTFDGPVPARHCSRKRWGSLSSIGVRLFLLLLPPSSFSSSSSSTSYFAFSFSSSSRSRAFGVHLCYPYDCRNSHLGGPWHQSAKVRENFFFRRKSGDETEE